MNKKNTELYFTSTSLHITPSKETPTFQGDCYVTVTDEESLLGFI